MITSNEFRGLSKGKLRGKMKVKAPSATVIKTAKGKIVKKKQVPPSPMPRLANNPAYII